MVLSITSFIKQFDSLSPAPQLNVESKSSYKTFIGGFMCLVINILTVIGAIYFSQTLFVKNDPIAIDSDKDFPEPTPFLVSEKTFSVFIIVEYANFSFYNDPTIFEFSAIKELYQTDPATGIQNYTFEPIEIKTCNNYYNSSSDITQTPSINIDLFHCLKPNETLIEGYFGHSIARFIRISLNKCTNTTENNNHCKDDDYIDSIIQGGVVNFFPLSHNIDNENYLTPVSSYLKDDFIALNVDITFTYVYLIGYLEYETDYGFLLQNIETNLYQYYEKPNILIYGKRDRLITEVEIQGTSIGRKISRSYTKIQDVLVKVGGLIKAFLVIGGFLTSFFSEFEFINDFSFNLKEKIQFSSKTDESEIVNYVNQNSPQVQSPSKLKNNNFNQVKFSCENADKKDLAELNSSKVKINTLVKSNNVDDLLNNKTLQNFNSNRKLQSQQSSLSELTIHGTSLKISFSNRVRVFCKNKFSKKSSVAITLSMITRRIQKLLSIDYIFNKFFELELLSHFIRNKEGIDKDKTDLLYFSSYFKNENANYNEVFSYNTEDISKLIRFN